MPLEANASRAASAPCPAAFRVQGQCPGRRYRRLLPRHHRLRLEENSSLSTNYNPNLPDLSQEAEYIAYAAAGGMLGDPATSVGTIAGVPPLPDIRPAQWPDRPGRRHAQHLRAGGDEGPAKLVATARASAQAIPTAARTMSSSRWADTLLQGQAGAAGLAGPAAQRHEHFRRPGVQTIDQGIAQAAITRAAIRLPLNSPTSMVFAVTDPATGEVLGLYRMPDSTIFSLDIAVAKARNVGYYNNPAQLQPQDRVPGIPDGGPSPHAPSVTWSIRASPEGIDGDPPGPFSILNDGGANPLTALTPGTPDPSAHQSVQGYDAYHPAPTSTIRTTH